MNALQTDATAQDARLAHTKNLISQFNKPHQCAVAVNATHIGDDNDYSCFLFRAWFALWLSGNKELALELANTDPMLNNQFTMEELEKEAIRHGEFLENEKETQDLYYKMYRD